MSEMANKVAEIVEARLDEFQANISKQSTEQGEEFAKFKESYDAECLASKEQIESIEKAMDEKLEERMAELTANSKNDEDAQKFADGKFNYAHTYDSPYAEDGSLDSSKLKIKRELSREKAGDTTFNIPGAGVGTITVFSDMVDFNPFNGLASNMTVGAEDGSFKAPTLSGITSQKNVAVGAHTETSTLDAGDTTIIDKYSSVARMSFESISDLNGLEALIARRMVETIADHEHTDIVAALDAKTITEAPTTTTAKLGDPDFYANAYGSLPWKWVPRARFVLSQKAWAQTLNKSQSGTGSPLFINPINLNMSIYGIPITVSTKLANGDTDEDIVGYIGSVEDALIIGRKPTLTMRRYEEESIGGITWYAASRAGFQVNEEPLVRLTVDNS